MLQAWTLVILGAAALLLRVGYALLTLGAVGSKNSAGIVCRSIGDTAASVVGFWAVGASLLLGTGVYLGFDRNLILNQMPESAGAEFFHLSVVCIGGAVVTAALAERANFYLHLIAAAALSAVVIPVAGHWVWFGWLGPAGWRVIDFGGSTAVHLAAAVFAAVGVAVVGSRAGKYTGTAPVGHALPVQPLGALLVLVGWFPYLLGCTIAHWPVIAQVDEVYLGVTATNVALAAAGGALAGLFLGHLRYQKPDLFHTTIGLLAGLVSITGGAVAVSSLGALVIGMVAGLIVPPLAALLDRRGRLDDPVHLIAVHGFGGLWGTLATAMFLSHLTFEERAHQLGIQALGAAAVVIWSAVAGVVVFGGCKLLGLSRLSAADEAAGTDAAEHDVAAYPEFVRHSGVSEPM